MQVSGAVYDIAGGKEAKVASVRIEGNWHIALKAHMPDGQQLVLWQANNIPREPRSGSEACRAPA